MVASARHAAGARSFAAPVAPEVVLRGFRYAGGDGIPVLLIHGLASNALMWSSAARELSARGHPTAALDLRGHGQSDKPILGYDFATLLNDLDLSLESLIRLDGDRWRRPVVVGQSLGANLVLEFAAAYPTKIRGVACVDGGTIELRERFSSWEQCAQELAPPDLSSLTWPELVRMLGAELESWPPEGVRAALANFTTTADGHVAPLLSRVRHMQLLEELWRHPATSVFGRVRTPVLLLPAAGGRGVPFTSNKRRDIERALASLPTATVRWFEDTDHDIHAQRPQELAEALDAAMAAGLLG